LTGGLTRDPELRRTRAGTAVTTLRLGFTTQRRVNGAWQERSNYVDVELWGARAETAVRQLKKGRQVAVDGRLEWREYETRSGERRQIHSIVADTVEFLAAGRGVVNAESDSEPAPAVEDEVPF
jgi:single-strand DNA-binding protein